MTFDISKLLGAVTREVRNAERGGKPAKIVVASRVYDTTLDDLWDAITKAERIARWLAPISGELKLGGQYQIQGNAGGTITRCEPPRELEVTWEFGGGVSWVEASLSEHQGGALLEVRHIAHPEAHWDQFGAGAVGVGWELMLAGLDAHLKDPTGPHTLEADPTWAASDEAKRFMKASGDGWGEAEIAGGADPESALARAERTKKFYCGET
jgi:uncharacterized protein YndB with AHSA1/START domain